jgi:hypothetical protein
MRQRQAAGGAIIDMALRLSGNVDGRMRVRLAGLPLDGGGLSLTGSQVDLTAPGLTRALQGRIVSLQGTEFLARLRGGGAAVEVRAQLNIDPNANTVTGTLYGTPAGGTP